MNECDEEAVALKKEESQLLIGRREAGASDTIPTERSDAGSCTHTRALAREWEITPVLNNLTGDRDKLDTHLPVDAIPMEYGDSMNWPNLCICLS